MDNAKMVKNMYPAEIMEPIRQRLGLEYNDTSMDNKIMRMSKGTVLKHVVSWDGLLGSYDQTIKNWVRDIYNIDLDEVGEEE